MTFLPFALALAALAPAVPAAERPPVGKQTAITNAAGGGLREWRGDPGDPSIVYVRDRTLRWYKVTLAGTCAAARRYDVVTYTTDPIGRFDRFSRVTFQGGGPITCLVDGIERIRKPPVG